MIGGASRSKPLRPRHHMRLLHPHKKLSLILTLGRHSEQAMTALIALMSAQRPQGNRPDNRRLNRTLDPTALAQGCEQPKGKTMLSRAFYLKRSGFTTLVAGLRHMWRKSFANAGRKRSSVFARLSQDRLLAELDQIGPVPRPCWAVSYFTILLSPHDPQIRGFPGVPLARTIPHPRTEAGPRPRVFLLDVIVIPTLDIPWLKLRFPKLIPVLNLIDDQGAFTVCSCKALSSSETNSPQFAFILDCSSRLATLGCGFVVSLQQRSLFPWSFPKGVSRLIINAILINEAKVSSPLQSPDR